MLDKERSCRAIPKPSPFSLRGPFLRSLVSRNYWPAVEKCGSALVPSAAMKEAEASASPCAFRRGEELPLTPAVCHKGPTARRGTRPLTRPPSAEADKRTKAGAFSPLCLNTDVGAKEKAASSPLAPISRSPVPLGAVLRWAVLPPLRQERFVLGLQVRSLAATALAFVPFTFFRSLSSKAVKTTFKILQYLWSAGLQCCSLLS